MYVRLQLARATYAYKYVLLQLMYTSTYFFNWTVPRTYSKGARRLHLVRTIDSTYAVLGSF